MGKGVSETGRMLKDMDAWCTAKLRAGQVLPCSKWQYRPSSSKYSSTDLTAALSKQFAIV